MRHLILSGLALLGLSLSACSTTGTVLPGMGTPFDKIEVAEGVDLASFERVYIAPVQVSEAVAKRIDYVPLNASDTSRPLSPGNVRRNVDKTEEEVKKGSPRSRPSSISQDRAI